ncbi:unnamed protein product [Effrenium voratum]|uniref:Uncharacterized protein n=1 Tax=Effrenium voratum TaxID=2562239 RepID=A0AA36NBH7_9DINO|nr:unnamed protein product [Effrenium voratum]
MAGLTNRVRKMIALPRRTLMMPKGAMHSIWNNSSHLLGPSVDRPHADPHVQSSLREHSEVGAMYSYISRGARLWFYGAGWWAGTTLDLYFSRCYVAHRDIGSSMALWWRVRQEVLQSFDASLGQQLLQRAVPETGTSVCVAMRPKGGKVTPAASED